jgi:hypothetical protein
MKKIFCAVLALAAMASCSKEYIVAEDKQAIGFGEAFVDNGTRADYSTGNKEVQKFKVYGTVKGKYDVNAPTVYIFDNETVSRPVDNLPTGYDTSEAWICTGALQYWVPNAYYNFTAVVDGELTADHSKINFTVADGTGNLDLLYATASAETDVDGAVSGDVTNDQSTLVKFQFAHLLSKLQFNAPTHNMSANYSVVVTDIKVSKVVDKGVYSVGGGTWDKAADANVNGIELDFCDAEDTFETRQILPLNQELAVTIKYDVKFNGTKIAEVTKNGTIPAQDYVKSTVYAITPNIEAKQIKFTVTGVTDWTTGSGITL